MKEKRSQGHDDDPRSTQVQMLTTFHWEPMTLYLITTHARFKYYSIYETVHVTMCIESDKVIMLKSWCGGLGKCDHDIVTKTGLTRE
jgi:hypothetical protein